MNSPQSTQLALFTLEKRCMKCHIVKPLDAFNICMRVLDGRKSRCKVCTAQENAEYRTRHRVVRPPRTEKTCSRCKVTKPLDAFRIRSKTGRREAYCIECVKEYKHERHVAHAQEVQARVKKWQAQNPDRVRANLQRWQESNPERVAKWRRAWELKNPVKATLIARLATLRRRTRLTNAGPLPTAQAIVQMYHDQHRACAYCGAPMEAYHLEHRTPLSRQGTNHTENLCLACPWCNNHKHEKTAEEFMEWLGTSSYHRQVP